MYRLSQEIVRLLKTLYYLENWFASTARETAVNQHARLRNLILFCYVDIIHLENMSRFFLRLFVLFLIALIPNHNSGTVTLDKRSVARNPFGCGRSPNALENLLPLPGGKEETEISIDDPAFVRSRTEVSFEGEDGKNGKIVKFHQEIALRVGVDTKRTKQINLLGNDVPDVDTTTGLYDFMPCAKQAGYYLTFEENSHTFIVYNPGLSNWFFTTSLTGCDMFVAKHNSDGRLLIIHSNLNKYGDMPQEKLNLETKSDMAQKIIQSHQGFQLVMRLYAKPSFPPALKYMEQYHKLNPSIVLHSYIPIPRDGHIFFGNGGKFYLKPTMGGETVELRF